MPTAHYLWDIDNDSYLVEKDGAGATTVAYTNEPVQYGKLISHRSLTGTRYFCYDGQWSTRDLTDQHEDLTDEYTFSAFGATQVRSGMTSNCFQYVGAIGYYRDHDTAPIYVRARTYSTCAGRWHSFDPAGYKVGTNLYANVLNVPVQLSDPSGQDFFDKKCVKTCDTLFGKGAKDESSVWRAFCQTLCNAARGCGTEKCKWIEDLCFEILLNGGCSFCPSGEPFRSAHYKCMDIHRQLCPR